MNNFLGTADKKKLKHIKQFEIEIDFNHMHKNIFGKSFSHDLMKEKSVHRKSMPRLTSWFKAREKKVQQQNKERKRERELPMIYTLSFDFLSDIFRWKEKIAENEWEVWAFYSKIVMADYTVHNL